MTEAKSLPILAAEPALLPLPMESAHATVCACGHDRNHQYIAPEPVYTDWGWLLFLIGVTAKPRSVVYRCIQCKQILASTRDPQVLSKFD